jgi:imidazolonepropionase-like amidohydrolase
MREAHVELALRGLLREGPPAGDGFGAEAVQDRSKGKAGRSMAAFLFTGGRVLDPERGEAADGVDVLVEGDRIKEVSDVPIRSASAERVDLRGRVLMPGLIDAHVHVIASLVDVGANAALPSSLAALRAGRTMEGCSGAASPPSATSAAPTTAWCARRGRAGRGPRLVIAGKALGQTGGHTDFRGRSDDRWAFDDRVGALGRICDGVDAVRRAAREEIKGGARFIKIMANGGVASPNDPIHALGFSREEVSAAVEEAANAGTYVSAHLYTDEAIRRCVECGVHSLEHCNLIQPETARLAARAGAVAVPTLVTYEALAARAPPSASAPTRWPRSRPSAGPAWSRWRSCARRPPMAYGSDLLGQLHHHQSGEFAIRGRVLPAREVVASATTVAAKLCRMEGEVGVLRAGAFADLVVVDGDPLENLDLLGHGGRHLSAIMKGGRFHKNAPAA